MSAKPDFEAAVDELAQAQKELKSLIKRGTYTCGELIEIRKRLLGVVRWNLDPHAFGHMPDKRHY